MRENKQVVILEDTRITVDASDLIHVQDVDPALESHRREREACRFDLERWGLTADGYGRGTFLTEHKDRNGRRFVIETEAEYPLVTVCLPDEIAEA